MNLFVLYFHEIIFNRPDLLPSLSFQEELVTKSEAQLNHLLTTTASIHRSLKRTTVVAAAAPITLSTTRRVATQTAVTLCSNPAQWGDTTPSQSDGKRLRSEEDEGDDDSNNNRVSSTEKLKLESQIDSERTAVAALTELSNLKPQQDDSPSKGSTSSSGSHKVVTSTGLNNHHHHHHHLSSSESLSVIPVSSQHHKELHAKLKDMSQLETAAVLMDISKKVIISPPNSNPHSPPHFNASYGQRNNNPDRVKRTNSSDMMMDLSIKRVKVEPQQLEDLQQQQQHRRESVIKTERGSSAKVFGHDQETVSMGNSEALLNTLKNRHQLNVIKLNERQSTTLTGLSVLNVDRLNGLHYDRVVAKEEAMVDEEAEEDDLDDDSSDPGRLQVDMSMETHREGMVHDDEEDMEGHHLRNGNYQQQQQQEQRVEGKAPRRGGGNKSKSGGRKNNHAMEMDGRVPSPMMGKGNAAAGITAAQLAASAMASMAGGPQDAHGLWHLIAQTTLNNNNGLPLGHQNKEAVQLLQQMIQNKNMQLNLGMPPMNLAALGEMQQPLSLLKVSS